MARPNEVFRRPKFRGPSFMQSPAGRGQFAGLTTLASGSASVTVSTGVINSNSMFRLATIANSVGAASNSGGHVVVNSIVSGVSFALARATATAIPWDEVVSWEIVKQSAA